MGFGEATKKPYIGKFFLPESTTYYYQVCLCFLGYPGSKLIKNRKIYR